jgi:hypothetical protein
MRSIFFYIGIGFICSLSFDIRAQETTIKTYKKEADTAIIGSIQRAVAYLQNPKTEVYFPDYAVYTYLQRRYNTKNDTILPDIRPAVQIKTQLIFDKNNRENFLPFVRLTPNINLNCSDWRLRMTHYTGIDSFTVRTLYADSLTINKAFLKKLQTFAEGDGYELTHAYLAMIWLSEHQHRICKTAFYEKLYTDFETKIIAFLDHKKPNEWLDIHSEALALLAYKNGLRYFKNDYIAAALCAQTPEGAWLQSEYDKTQTAHAAALTLWLLCEHQFGKKTYPNWIVR